MRNIRFKYPVMICWLKKLAIQNRNLYILMYHWLHLFYFVPFCRGYQKIAQKTAAGKFIGSQISTKFLADSLKNDFLDLTTEIIIICAVFFSRRVNLFEFVLNKRATRNMNIHVHIISWRGKRCKNGAADTEYKYVYELPRRR